jgi:hypothetical protein
VFRALVISVILAVGCLCQSAAGHEPGEHEPLACNPAAGESCYYAVVDDFHANPSTTDSIGEIFLTLNSERTELRYTLLLDDLLGLKPNREDRTEPDDILGIHLHVHVDGAIGPHVLNIFGLATPTLFGEEDADLVVDYEHHTLTGIYDMSDATLDPDTGQPYPEIFFATSKVLDFGLFVLERDEMVVAVHTVESGFTNYAIHGHIHRVVPEPAGGLLISLGLLLATGARGNRGHRVVGSAFAGRIIPRKAST